MHRFQYGTTTITYSLEYIHGKKDVSLSVCKKDGVKLIVPKGLDSAQINTILYKKAPWILKKKSELDEIVPPAAPKEFVSGEKFPYLGRHYRLKVHKNDNYHRPALMFRQGKFIAAVPSNLSEAEKREQLKVKFKEWYIDHGKKKVEERLQIYAPKMNLWPEKIVLKEQQKRWGSCTPRGNVYLNWKIMMAPMSVVDYVLVHELAHLKYMNHSKEYWRFVRSILPDYEQRKEWLRINGPSLTL